MPSDFDLWRFLLPGYLITVGIELPILLLLLSKRHARKERLLAGFGLTGFTYPIVVLALPGLLWQSFGRVVYLIGAESFAVAAECLLFQCLWIAPLIRSTNSIAVGSLSTNSDTGPPSALRGSLHATARDFFAIALANVASFAPVEIMRYLQWSGV